MRDTGRGTPRLAPAALCSPAPVLAVNGRVHQETAAVPADRREGAPAPAARAAYALGEERLVGDDQTIWFGSVRYSTPPGHAGTRVWCRVAGEEMVITARTGYDGFVLAPPGRLHLAPPGDRMTP